MSEPLNPILRVKDLRIEFTDKLSPETAVFDFDLSLNRGEIVGLVGESGAGKSLSALAIAGLLKRHSLAKDGQILFKGKDLLTCDRKTLRGFQGNEISVVFQEPLSSLNPLMRVGPQVEESLRVHSPGMSREKRRERALIALREAGLDDSERIYSSYPHELSGGMRQRVMIAAAIISEPELIIADEPTTALDVTVQAQIIKLLKEINKKRDCAILFISHDLSLVRTFCDRVVVMKDGRIIEGGDVDEVFFHPRSDYVKELIDAIPKIEKKEAYPVPGEPVLKLSHVSAGYQTGFGGRGFKGVIEDISLELKKGEILGLAGESGSGKSTAAKVIMGLLPAACGEISRPDGAKMIFQDPYSSLNPAHTVEWILREALTRGRPRDYKGGALAINEAVDRALSDAELSADLKKRRPAELSGGQRQRVAIAEAIISNPRLVVADEPVSALDVTVQAQIIALMEKLRKEKNMAILLISHDLRVIHRLCDRVLILKSGRIVEGGDVDRIYERPEHEYTKELLRAAVNSKD